MCVSLLLLLVVVVVVGWLVFFLEVQRNKEKKKVFPRFYKKQSSREKVRYGSLSTGIGSERPKKKNSFLPFVFDFIHKKTNKFMEINPEKGGDGGWGGEGQELSSKT